uniref:Uncharacterized protein n=1 Tax=Arundo donax TaxID=35708 RepID=A0A0A8XYN2_ARUDO
MMCFTKRKWYKFIFRRSSVP